MNIGDRLGKVTIIDIVTIIKSGKPRKHYTCQCDCGNIVNIRADSILKTHFASCGCEKINNKIKTLLSQDRLHDGVKNIGDTYGELTIKELVNPLGQIKYRCSCTCGNETIVRFDHLIKGETKSCGCKTKQFLREKCKIEKGRAAFNDLYNSYKHGAKSRGISFLLTKEEFEQITKQSCKYCNSIPSQVRSVKGNNGEYVYNGIDRVDSLSGYVLSNCVACCSMCNYMKRDYSIEEFKNHIVKLYHNFAKLDDGSGNLSWA